MTVACIAGMHRSGTSMVARLLNVAGLHLGPQRDMVPATADNAEGHWENVKFVSINDDLLAELGGGWDYPPRLQGDWPKTESLALLRRKACLIVGDFADCSLWGWKDPRTSILADFWLSVVPELKFVICLRHPLEVAESLQRRNMFSRARSLALWREYNEQLLLATNPAQRIVTHYDAYFDNLPSELTRVCEFLSAPLSQEALETCATAVRGRLRHNRAEAHQLLDLSVPTSIFDLYTAMCDEAGWRGTCGDGVLDDMTYANGAVDPRDQAIEELKVQAQGLEAEVARVNSELERRDRRLDATRLELESLSRDLAALRSSNSWRVTAPLRGVTERLNRLYRLVK